MNELTLVIPIEPPSGNHYKTYRQVCGHVSWYLTKEAMAWLQAVQLYARGSVVAGKKHVVEYTVHQGAKSKGDVDNYAKCILDGLVKAGVLKSDASVVSLHAHKLRNRENPRTEITVRAI